VASRDLARPPDLPCPQARLRGLPDRTAVPGVRRGRDGPGEGEEAAEVREGRPAGPAPEPTPGLPGRGWTARSALGRRMTCHARRRPEERTRGRRALTPGNAATAADLDADIGVEVDVSVGVGVHEHPSGQRPGAAERRDRRRHSRRRDTAPGRGTAPPGRGTAPGRGTVRTVLHRETARRRGGALLRPADAGRSAEVAGPADVAGSAHADGQADVAGLADVAGSAHADWQADVAVSAHAARPEGSARSAHAAPPEGAAGGE